jgi:sec-independent protein translocase protein TatB
MFLDAGAEEIMVVAIAALVFVGPKDLPLVLRRVGQFTAKMRGLAAEFRASFDEMARQSELDELRKEVEALRRGDYTRPIHHEVENHFEALHRELGAPAPAGVGAREGEIVRGPDAPALPPPETVAAAPTTLSQAPEAAAPLHHEPPAHEPPVHEPETPQAGAAG